MLRLLQYIITGHSHRWKVLEQVGLLGIEGSRGTRFILQCEQCGNVRKRDLI